MRKYLLGINLFIMTTSSFATTAILCGNPAKVDQDNKNALVHLIFDNEDSRSADEISVAHFGQKSKIGGVTEKNGFIYIYTPKPDQVLVINKKSLNYSSCDGETTFSIHKVREDIVSPINNCRCFAD